MYTTYSKADLSSPAGLDTTGVKNLPVPANLNTAASHHPIPLNSTKKRDNPKEKGIGSQIQKESTPAGFEPALPKELPGLLI